MTPRLTVLHLADQRERGVVPIQVGEVGTRRKQQRVTRRQLDITDFRAHALALPVDRDDRGIVVRAKARLPNGLPDELRLGRHDGFDQPSVGTGLNAVGLTLVGRHEAADLLQLHDAIDDARKQQQVIGV